MEALAKRFDAGRAMEYHPVSHHYPVWDFLHINLVRLSREGAIPAFLLQIPMLQLDLILAQMVMNGIPALRTPFSFSRDAAESIHAKWSDTVQNGPSL